MRFGIPGRLAGVVAATLTGLACGERGAEGSANGATITALSYARASALVERAVDVLGSADAIVSAGGIEIRASGSMFQAAEYQGRDLDAFEAAPFNEILAVNPSMGYVAYEYRHERYDGTSDWIREIFLDEHDHWVVGMPDRFAVTLESPEHRLARTRLSRRIPQLLLAEVSRERESLRWIGSRGSLDAVSANVATGETVTLLFDAASGVLAYVEYVADIQGFGDAAVVWRFDEYQSVADLGSFPHRYRVSVDSRTFLDATVNDVLLGSSPMFDPPADLPARRVALPSDPTADARVVEVELETWVVRNLRTGFHPLFVEFEDFVVAVDAPAGYRLLNELPGGDVAPGATSDWLAARYIELIKQTAPGKPIRYVIVSHYHNDHAGGVRAFIAEGATIVAAPSASVGIRELYQRPHTLAPDRLSWSPAPLQLEVVDGQMTITDGTRRMHVIDVGVNPHTDDMLVVHLPEESLVYVSDLLTAAPAADFPIPENERLDRFFIRWLGDRGLDPARVFSMHGTGSVSRAMLQRVRGGN